MPPSPLPSPLPSSSRSLLLALALAACAAAPASVVLQNAADPGVVNAISGLGTAGGGTDHGYGVWPECWASCSDAQCLAPNPSGCKAYTMRAVAQFIALGGRRVDSANGYRNQDAVGAAINAAVASGAVKREELFVGTKIGAYLPMGYGETWNQTAIILRTTQLEYLDNILMHWPDCETGGGCGPSTDPLCDYGAPTYNAKGCRLSTWRALLDIWKSGLVRSVGVSNFNISQ